MVDHHPDDEFHPSDPADPFWTETCWFTFTVPERRLSGQFYPFFRTNQGVLSAGAFFWDDTGTTPADILHARHFWHLPIPDQPLSDIQLPNGIAYRCLEPLRRYELTYEDPDGDDRRRGRRARPDLHRRRPAQLSRGVPPRPARPVPGHHRPRRGGDRRRLLRVPRPVVGPAVAVRPGHPRHPGPLRWLQLCHRLGPGRLPRHHHGLQRGCRAAAMAIHGYLLRDGDMVQGGLGPPAGAGARPRHRLPDGGGPRPGRRVWVGRCTPKADASTAWACSSIPTCTPSTA